MQSLEARLLLALVLAVGMSSPAFAGVTTSTTVGTTSTTVGTTSTTVGTTSTTVGTTSTTVGTTSTTVGTTSTTVATTSTTSTTTTTMPSGDLSGQYTFLDALEGGLDVDNQSFLDISVSTGRFCLAGLVQGEDPGEDSEVPRLVTLEYRSLGAIGRANGKRVTGEFGPVVLTLTIEQSDSPVFAQTITPACRLKGALREEGNRGKARLECEVGRNLAAFGLSPETSQGFIDNVDAAFSKQPHIQVNTKTGRIRITNNGKQAPDGEATLTCP